MITEKQQLTPDLWVKNYADYLYSYALLRLNDQELARDLVQETFLAALQKVETFEGKSSEKTWLTAIIKYKIIDIYRKKSSGLKQISITDAEQEQQQFFNSTDGHWTQQHRPIDFGANSQDQLNNKEFNQVLQQCMQKLPVLWLSVFTMKYIDDELTETICAGLSITTANFWVIIHRAKLNLRACLQKNWL